MHHPPGERLDSWKEIAAYLRRDLRTVRRWEKTRALPVRRVPGEGRQAVYAFRNEIEAWLSPGMEQPAVGAVSSQGEEDDLPRSIPASKEEIQRAESAMVGDVSPSKVQRPMPRLRFAWVSGAILVFAAALSTVLVGKHAEWKAALTTSPDASPMIISVSPILPLRDQTIVINGTGFGLHTAYRSADTPFIAVRDKTAQWAAGRIIPQNWDAVTLDVESWQDTQIVISGFSGAYGSSHWQLAKGDKIEIAVWNPQTARGPAIYHVAVSASR